MDNRTKILEGAAELFRRYGIRSVTMDMIASHVGVSKRTIYEIFSDKNELLAGVLSLMASKQKNLIEKILSESENIIAAIFRLMEVHIEHIQSMSPGFFDDMKKFHQELAGRKDLKCEIPDYRNNRQAIERGVKEKLFRKDINIDIVNRTLYGMMFSVMNNDLYPFEQFSRRDVLKNTIVIYLKGIATPEGLEIIQKLEKNL
ncbi:MAG TPA: helix-turn-helix domain-containing protein [Bacteroidales bacterium]|nr:helix-turn-helix domain-containing protein [Bacteroidales bacterium]